MDVVSRGLRPRWLPDADPRAAAGPPKPGELAPRSFGGKAGGAMDPRLSSYVDDPVLLIDGATLVVGDGGIEEDDDA